MQGVLEAFVQRSGDGCKTGRERGARFMGRETSSKKKTKGRGAVSRRYWFLTKYVVFCIRVGVFETV